jgi:hypothetical protein
MISNVMDKVFDDGEVVPVGVGVKGIIKLPGDRTMSKQNGCAKLVDRTTITVNTITKQRLESLMCEGEILDTTLLRILNEYHKFVNNSKAFDYRPLELICETHNGDRIIVPIARSKINFTHNNRIIASQDYQKQTRLEQEKMTEVGME